MDYKMIGFGISGHIISLMIMSISRQHDVARRQLGNRFALHYRPTYSRPKYPSYQIDKICFSPSILRTVQGFDSRISVLCIVAALSMDHGIEHKSTVAGPEI